MAGLSNQAAADWLDYEFGNVPYTPSPTHDICLYSVAPNSAGAGGTELSGDGYAPVTVDNDLVTWESTSAKRKLNAIIITFVASGGDWDAAVAVVVKDDGGNVRGMGALDPTVLIRDGQTRDFNPGELIIQAV